jgi:hypothetical protein
MITQHTVITWNWKEQRPLKVLSAILPVESVKKMKELPAIIVGAVKYTTWTTDRL